MSPAWMAAMAWRSSAMNWSKCLSILLIRFCSEAGAGRARSSASDCSAFVSDCGRTIRSSAELCGVFSSELVAFSSLQIAWACFAQSASFTSSAGAAGAGLWGAMGAGAASSPGDPENANANAAIPRRASNAVGTRTRSRRFDFMCFLSARARVS